MDSLKKLRCINIAAMLMVAIFNIIDCIYYGRSALEYALYGAPFVIGAIVLLAAKTYKINAILYALAGLIVTATGSKGNFSGAVFLMFSFYIFNNFTTTCTLIAVASITMVSRYLFMGHTIPATINLFVSYAFVFSIYFILIHPKQKPKPIISKVDDITRDIVKYLKDGLRVKEIAPLVFMSPDSVYHRLKRAREKYACGNNIELYEKLEEQGFFMQKNDGVI